MRETAQSERLCHQRYVLQDHALLDGDKLCDQCLELLDGERVLGFGIVV